MKIKKEILEKIQSYTECYDREVGGIIGAIGGVISLCECDSGKISEDMNLYFPDVSKLNNVISNWEEVGIEFSGLFHSHLNENTDLSADDRYYIKKIMEVMPAGTDKLYFPVISKTSLILVAHSAERKEALDVKYPEYEIVFRCESLDVI